jgi:hypothetical protein
VELIDEDRWSQLRGGCSNHDWEYRGGTSFERGWHSHQCRNCNITAFLPQIVASLELNVPSVVEDPPVVNIPEDNFTPPGYIPEVSNQPDEIPGASGQPEYIPEGNGTTEENVPGVSNPQGGDGTPPEVNDPPYGAEETPAGDDTPLETLGSETPESE